MLPVVSVSKTYHVRPHEAAHVAQRTHESDARSRGGPAKSAVGTHKKGA